MYLCKYLHDLNGNRYPMCGCFPFETRMFSRTKALGYREVTVTADTVIGNAGEVVRGHEFHYSEMIPPVADIASVYRTADRRGMNQVPGGYFVNQTLGSYNHLHFGSNPQTAAVFVENCRRYHHKRASASAA
jgi:cobyrinic acid a,c-diamide synthase